MLRDTLAGLIEPMLASAGACPSRTRCHLSKPEHRTIDPRCLENPRPEGAEPTLTGNVASPFHAEPRHLDDIGEADNTIVVFTTDNGAEVFTWPDGGMTPFKGTKSTSCKSGRPVSAFQKLIGNVGVPGGCQQGGQPIESRHDTVRNRAGLDVSGPTDDGECAEAALLLSVSCFERARLQPGREQLRNSGFSSRGNSVSNFHEGALDLADVGKNTKVRAQSHAPSPESEQQKE